jgi:predicted nucleotide-binding protein (sugar kinase/HSP70/actin superfamily)
MLKGKTILIPPMDYSSARVLAAAFRAAGLHAEALEPSDERTRETGERYTSGDECRPFQILAGDVMKRLEDGGVDPARTAIFLPLSAGSCRVSRSVPDLRDILERSGYGQAEILTPRPSGKRGALRELGEAGIRTAWRALVSAGILQKLLLHYRPYEMTKGDADRAHERSLEQLSSMIEAAPFDGSDQLKVLVLLLQCFRDRFREIPVKGERSAPLIGIVGETFCRFNALLNNDLIRQIEGRGGEARLMGMMGEVRRYAPAVAGLSGKLGDDERALMEPFLDECAVEPDMDEIMAYARPYLPVESGFPESSLRLGQVVTMAREGVDGIIDVTPFPCMVGPACVPFYPRVSRDLSGLPIRTFYFHGTKQDWSIALDDYLGTVRAYREGRHNWRK